MITYIFRLTVVTAVLAAAILWPAGTLQYPAGWLLIMIGVFGSAALIIWLAKHNPGLLRERMASPLQRDQKPWDRIWLVLFLLGFCAWLALSSRDAARNGFDSVPLWLQALGAVLVLLQGAGIWWTFRENSFAAPVVKLQQGQRTIDTGPYAIVRHPMYTSALLLFLGVPLLLGSWVGLALSLLFILALAWRTVREEKTLRAELGGYEAYVRRVRYRFVPYIW